jgi:polyisoprenoid-binding protein YceI
MTAAAGMLLSLGSIVSAQEYTLDASHAAVSFRISHLGLSWTVGRFNDVAGDFTIDREDPSKSSFRLTIKTAGLDTGNAKRDEHLKSPDFFNVKQFPAITFQSTSVQPTKNGYEVTGDLSLHGETKSVKLTLVGGRTAEFPKGVQRTGFSTEAVVKRSEFGMDKFAEAVGDDVQVFVSFEGTKK